MRTVATWGRTLCLFEPLGRRRMPGICLIVTKRSNKNRLAPQQPRATRSTVLVWSEPHASGSSGFRASGWAKIFRAVCPILSPLPSSCVICGRVGRSERWGQWSPISGLGQRTPSEGRAALSWLEEGPLRLRVGFELNSWKPNSPLNTQMCAALQEHTAHTHGPRPRSTRSVPHWAGALGNKGPERCCPGACAEPPWG